MKVKKVLALLLALTLTVGLLPGRALAADDDEFTVVNSEQELTDALNEGAEKIKLGKDISSKKELVLKQDVVFDLDGHTWSGTEFQVGKRGDITVQNGTVSFIIVVDGGKLTLTKLKLEGDIYCVDGKLVSMEDCTSTGGNGDDWPVGILVRENGEVGTIKNCTINLTGNVSPSPLFVEGSVDTIEGCTFTATNKGAERSFSVVEIYDGGSVGTIKDCTITANGKSYCAGIKIWDGASVKSIEGGTITAKNTATGDEPKFDDGIVVEGRLGTVKDCTITARSSISGSGKIDEISGCILNAEYGCIYAGGSIGSILSNTMTATGTYGMGMEVSGSVETVAYNNMVRGAQAFLIVHDGGEVNAVTSNVGDSDMYLNKGGEVGTISGNIIYGLTNNEGTIALLGSNVFEEEVANKGTIKKTNDSSPVDSLDKSKWYYDAMAYAYDENLTFGIPDNQFKPDDKLTRSMLTQMLWNLEEWPASKIGTFTDVESGAWYRNSVSWAADKKIVEGYTDGSFKPDNYITREQVATILYRYVKGSGGDVSNKADLSGYADASSISAYAREAMQWANAEKLITGTSGTALSPKGNTTCAQMATILMRLVEGPEKPQPLNLKTGTWAAEGYTVGDKENGWTALYLKSVNGNTLTFTLEQISAAMSFNRVAVTDPITVTLENGKGTFRVEDDGWFNSGTGVITVKGDYIHVSVDITKPNPMANWSIGMDKDFYPAQSSSGQPDKITVMVGGSSLSLSQVPYQHGGEVMIPMEPVFEAVGIAVFEDEWGATVGMTESHAIMLDRKADLDDNDYFELHVDTEGLDVDLSELVHLSGDYHYIPMEMLDVFGLQTNWDPAKQVITVQGTIAKADRVSAQKIAALKQFDKDEAAQRVQKAGYSFAPAGSYYGYHSGGKYWTIPVYVGGDIQYANIFYDGTSYQMNIVSAEYID